jgi:hypothetical protein
MFRAPARLNFTQGFTMKKAALSLTIAALGLTAFATSASAQRYDERTTVSIPVPSVVVRDGRGGDRRAGYDLERLNQEVRRLRPRVFGFGGGRMRYEFARISRAADQLNNRYQRGGYNGWRLRREIEDVRAQVARLEADLRTRGDRPRGWR